MTEYVRVGDVLSLQRREVTIDPTSNYTLIGVFSFGKGIFFRTPKPGSELGDYRFFEIKPGDLVLSNIQAWEGAIAQARDRDAGAIGTHRFLTYVPQDSNRIDTGWARWYFLSEHGMRLILKAAPGTTVRNRTLAIDRFEALEIPLPPIDEQRHVAEKLNALEAATTEIRRGMERVSSLSAALIASSVARPDLDADAKARAGWRQVHLSDVLAVSIDEVQVNGAELYQVAGIYSFGRGMFKRTAIEGSRTSYKTLHRLHAGQLVMSRLKAWEGAIAMVPEALDGWFLSPEFPTFDCDSGQVAPDYFSALLTSEQFWSRLRGASRGIGARRERVHAERLLEQEIDLPSLRNQRSIEDVLTLMGNADARRSSAGTKVDALVPAALNDVFGALS